MKTDDKPGNVVCSVCIANYNGSYFLEACLDSVFQQDFSFNYEIIVHDDASTDNSIDIVAEKYPAVRLLMSPTNVGFCVSNNRMAAVAKGKYILLLNNDAVLHRNALSAFYNYTVTANTYGIVGLPQYSMETGELLDMGSFLDPFLNSIPNKNRTTDLNVGMVIGACMWLPKKLWDELGGFPEWFGSLSEDKYLCCRARLRGYPVVSLSQSGFDHWVGKSFGGGKVTGRKMHTTYRRRALSELNRSYVMMLCYPSPLAQVLLPLHLLVLTLEGWLLSILKQDGRIWRDIYRHGLKALWRHRKQLICRRREIQGERRVSTTSFFAVHTFWPHKLTMLIKFGLPTLQ